MTRALALQPSSLSDANAYVVKHHRHHKASKGHKFSLAAAMGGGKVVGVAIVGRPVARALQDGWTLEVVRLCTDGTRNACSFLYGAARQAALALGYSRIITYTLASESGASLRAAGFRLVRRTRGGTWDRPSRPRTDKHPTEPKNLWMWP